MPFRVGIYPGSDIQDQRRLVGGTQNYKISERGIWRVLFVPIPVALLVGGLQWRFGLFALKHLLDAPAQQMPPNCGISAPRKSVATRCCLVASLPVAFLGELNNDLECEEVFRCCIA
jgi:hypothetical protein